MLGGESQLSVVAVLNNKPKYKKLLYLQLHNKLPVQPREGKHQHNIRLVIRMVSMEAVEQSNKPNTQSKGLSILIN